MKIGKVTYSTKAIFVEISDFGHGILGKQGFFDMFVVAFDYKKEEIELKERRKPLKN